MGKDDQPKVLAAVGGKPILWHIMKYYSAFGFNDFVLCLGYKANFIYEYFKNNKEFNIEFIDTGVETNTGGRIKKIEKYIREDSFFATYGDGLSDIDLRKLESFHSGNKGIATISVVKPRLQFGVVDFDGKSKSVKRFKEKPVLNYWINGGFFVFSRKVFEFLKESDILEKQSFVRLLKTKAVFAKKHSGFWVCMDTYKDNLVLNEIWAKGNAPWRIW